MKRLKIFLKKSNDLWITGGAVIGTFLTTSTVFADPVTGFFGNLQGDMTGIVASSLGAVGVVVSGLGLMHSEGGGWHQKALKTALGASIAVGAVGVITLIHNWVSS